MTAIASVDMSPTFTARIEVEDFGIYELLDRSGRDFKAQSTAGYSSVISTRHLRSTQKVPLRQGQVFGFNFAITDPAAEADWVPVQMLIEHPQTVNYLGKASLGFKKTTAARLHKDGRFHNGAFYIFSEPYELVPGEWTITVIYGEREVVRRFWVE